MKFNFEKKTPTKPAPNVRHISVPYNLDDPDHKFIWEGVVTLQAKYNMPRTEVVRTLLKPAMEEALNEKS